MREEGERSGRERGKAQKNEGEREITWRERDDHGDERADHDHDDDDDSKL